MSEVYQPEGCRDVLFMYDAIAEALGVPDGQRGVVYYLEEARTYLARGDLDFALYALIDALAQDDCTARQWSKIMLAIKMVRRAGR